MKILIAVDFGLFGKAQIDMMRKMSLDTNTKVKVLHVIEPLYWEMQTSYPTTMSLSDAIINEGKEAAKKLVNDVADQLQAQTSIESIDTEVRQGNTSDQILDAAESFGADLLIVGSHGKSGIARFLLGGTSQSISTHAKCSVLIARSAESSGDTSPAK